jgi:hypothetical protein
MSVHSKTNKPNEEACCKESRSFHSV